MIKGQLKVNNREKQRKIKPIKQPVKIIKVANIQHSIRVDDHLTPLEKDSKIKAIQPVNKNNDLNISTRESICTDLLVQGNIQSFIDLFYISHKCLPNVMEKKNYFGEPLYIPEDLGQFNEEKLQYLKQFSQKLIKSEQRPDASRQEKENSMNQYNSIAFNYEDQEDFITAAYFYQKVIDLAISCKNKQYQLVALLGLGKCNDQGQKKDKAIDILEQAFDNACILDNEEQKKELVKLIAKELIQLYIRKAKEHEKVNVQMALKAYESGLQISRRAKELDNEARIAHKIGQLYYQEAMYKESCQYQEKYLQLLKKNEEENLKEGDEMGQQKQNATSMKFKEMEAHASLAKCYLKIKDIEKTQSHLNDYHRMAKQAKAQNSLADSSYYLAKLFEEKGQNQKAILYYQSYFQAAKSQKQDKKDRKLVDKARVTFAIAKANKNMDKYISIFSEQHSLKAVLDWKIKRILK